MKKKSLSEIKKSSWFEKAPKGSECDACGQQAKGTIYYWCGDKSCCSPPRIFYCDKDLQEKFE